MLSAIKRAKLAYSNENLDNISRIKTHKQGISISRNRTLYVAFKGTSKPCDILNNIVVTPRSFLKNTRVHGGFLDLFEEQEEGLTEEIKKHDINNIIFSGHSRGGSISALAALYYKKTKNINSSVYTFGSPAMGDLNFANEFNANISYHMRVELDKDIVPYLKIHHTFTHFSEGFRINTSDNTIQTKYSIKPMTLIDVFNRLENVHEYHSCDKYIENIRLI